MQRWRYFHLFIYVTQDVTQMGFLKIVLLTWSFICFSKCYNPKFLYTCIHGLGPLTCIFCQSTDDFLFLKKQFLECMHSAPLFSAYIRLLYHYNSRTYTCCTIIARVYLKKLQKIKICKEFIEIDGLLEVSQLIHLL
jgi:hypothetical protein